MKLSFVSDTYPNNRVYDLCKELQKMEGLIASLNEHFPFNIGVALRCLPDSIGRKSFCHFNSKDNYLTIDITVSEDTYQALSMNEQREQLGMTFISFFKSSLLKNKKRASVAETTYLIQCVENWMRDNNWIDSKLAVARELLLADNELFYVSEQTSIPLDEIEDLLCKITGTTFDEIHRDNKKPFILY